MATYRIASFNMKNLGRTSIAPKSSRDFSAITEIIRAESFDIVAFQEILSDGQALDYYIKHYLPGWDLVFKEPPDSSDPSKMKDKRGEGYAFVWNTKRFRKAEAVTDRGMRTFVPRIIDTKSAREFARAPLYGRFEPINGGFFELRLINVHLHFGDNSTNEISKRKKEFELLVNEVYPYISMNRRYANNRPAYTIAMGDYNLNLFVEGRKTDILTSTYIERELDHGRQHIVTIQDQLTTLRRGMNETEADNPAFHERGFSNNYDHFTLDQKTFVDNGIKYKGRRIDAVRKYYNDDFDLYRVNISDHVPIVIELEI